MSYYTGPIFEIAMDEYGGSVGGGGRYDEMIGKFTGNQTCACGFSIGFERIVMLLLERDYQIPGAQKKKAYLIEKNMPAEGMQKIYKQFTTTMEGMGVEPIEAVGKEFNPDFHNAVMHVEDEAVGENIVVEELQKGYTYKGFVVRHSMVKVAN